MRHLLIIGLLTFTSAFASLAGAQEVSPQESRILTAVAKCLLVGLPQDWYEAQVAVTLDEPGAPAGEARYVFTRQLARADMVPFTPCNSTDPARALVEMRGLQVPEKRDWKSVRFVLHRDGKFDLTYDYPKQP
jgi:hypothetical protein